MTVKWSELVEILNKIGDLYEKMIVLAEEKRDALVNVKVSELNKIIEKEEALIKEIESLEKERIVLVDKIAKASDWPNDNIKLAFLIESAPEDFAPQMKQVGQRLADTVLKIATLNGINNNLLKQAMRVTEYNINILSQSKAMPFYESGGDYSGGKSNHGLSVFNQKA